ncbi:MAG: universal stress protein, partial [Verrucomicrobia bacterium]|nr:universal stress protein [Verrucomicrobiota bacterium]
MKENLKILIGYDGSHCAEAALNDLRRAGLPRGTEAIVLSVADVWRPPPGSEFAALGEAIPPSVRMARAHAIETEEEARKLAEQAAARLREHFPGWQVSTATCHDAPWWGILQQAGRLKADMIVVGSHGRSALGRMVLGSISQRVATEASCSVRIARGQFAEDVAPPRLIVAVDGSEHSNTTMNWVAQRAWPAGTAAHVVAFVDIVRVPAFSPDYVPGPELIMENHTQAEAQLRQFTQTAAE